MDKVCEICNGTGLQIKLDREVEWKDKDGVVVKRTIERMAQPCDCHVARRSTRMIEQAHIPERYRHCTLEDFVPNYDGENKTLQGALIQANEYVKSFPTMSERHGLVLLGTVGLGKTHLAVGILRGLIEKWRVNGLFCDYRDLLKRIQDSYGRKDVSERQVLAPVFDAEVLVIDELGAAKPTEWVWDTVQHILNTRYNDRKVTIITTNYPNLGETRLEDIEKLSDAKKSMREQTLGDRITERMRSRLHEMCVMVEMEGKDFRKSGPGRATFAKRKYTAAELFSLGTSKQAAENGIGADAEDDTPRDDRRSSKLEKKQVTSPTKQSSLLKPEKVWTQADIDREVAMKTAISKQRTAKFTEHE